MVLLYNSQYKNNNTAVQSLSSDGWGHIRSSRQILEKKTMS
jgi:hypothetical protein